VRNFPLNFSIRASLWDKFVFRLMAVRHRHQKAVYELSEPGTYRLTCSCGGDAEFWRADDGDSVLIDSTCPLWLLTMKLQRNTVKKLKRPLSGSGNLLTK
jgi:hypothetical protein